MLALSPTPLLQDVRLAVSTPGGNCEYWRVDACNRLLFGGDALVPGAFEIGSQHLEERLRHLFPSLRAALAWGDVRVEARWRGSDTLTTSALPYPMEVESSGGARIAVLTGGNGEGNVTGRTIAALAAKAHVRQDENFFDAFKGLNQPFIGGAFPAAVALWLEHVLDADGLAAQLQAAVYRGRDRS